jgi:hypothetical protein
MIRRILMTAACLAAGATGVALAHHSGAMFDRSQVVTVAGEVHEWRWSNPHSWLQIHVDGEDGEDGEKVLWSFEATSQAILARQGWRRSSLQPGEVVEVHFNPLRNQGTGGNLAGVTKADGTELGNVPALTEAGD